MADLVAEIERRMDAFRAESRRMRLARRAYDRWRARTPWRWVPARLHPHLFRMIYDRQAPEADDFIASAREHRRAIANARLRLHAPDTGEVHNG